MAEMTHERCSELLRAYAAGELPAADAGAVRAHLDECEDCRAEEKVVAALVVASEPEPLTDLERARLHRDLFQEVWPGTRANADLVAPAPGPGWKRWVVPALGSAAAVLVALLVVTGGLTGGGDDQGSAAMGGADADGGGSDTSLESSEQAIEPGGGGGGGGSGAVGDRQTAKDDAFSAAAGAAGAAYNDAGPEPQFDADAGELSSERLSALGRSSDLFRSFANGYTVDDVDGLRSRFVRRLASQSGAASAQVRECAATLPQDEPILAAYGATGTYDDRDALVLGFVTNDAGSASLDRYLMWVWTKGSCRAPIDTLFERIDD
jgi:hypothetical protein